MCICSIHYPSLFFLSLPSLLLHYLRSITMVSSLPLPRPPQGLRCENACLLYGYSSDWSGITSHWPRPVSSAESQQFQWVDMPRSPPTPPPPPQSNDKRKPEAGNSKAKRRLAAARLVGDEDRVRALKAKSCKSKREQKKALAARPQDSRLRKCVP